MRLCSGAGLMLPSLLLLGYATADAAVTLRTPVPPEAECPQYPPLTDIADDAAVAAAVADATAFLSSLVDKHKYPGLVASIVYQNTTLWSGGFGSQNASDPSAGPPTGSSLFRVASITKSFTGALLFALRDAGVVSPDDRLAKYLADFALRPAPGDRAEPRDAVTLRMLASHTSGLPREPFAFTDTNTSTVLAALRSRRAALPPAARFHYSNLGFNLLGHALGAAQQVPYEALVTQQILEPVGIRPPSGFDAAAAFGRLAQGYDRRDDGSLRLVSPIVPEGWSNPCGGLFASADDIAEWTKVFVGGGGCAKCPSLGALTARELLLGPAIALRDGHATVGYPWESNYSQSARQWVRGKDGGLRGYRSRVAMMPALGLAVFVGVLQDPIAGDDGGSVYTQELLERLAGPVSRLLWSRAPAPQLPTGAERNEGVYGPANARYRVTADAALGRLNVTRVPGGGLDHVLYAAGDAGEDVWRAAPAPAGAPHLACRWFDDGFDSELAYFSDCPGGDKAERCMDFMGGRYGRISAE